MDLIEKYGELLVPAKLWTRKEVLSKEADVPNSPGLYAWYFKDFIEHKYVKDCLSCHGFKLMYIGISPSSSAGKQTLNDRIKQHLRGNAYGSTLRLSLGCILSESLGIQLKKIGDGNRMTFDDGETKLNEWLEDNARVAWKAIDAPWDRHEVTLIKSLSLPLNLDMNNSHLFYEILREKRKAAKQAARDGRCSL